MARTPKPVRTADKARSSYVRAANQADKTDKRPGSLKKLEKMRSDSSKAGRAYKKVLTKTETQAKTRTRAETRATKAGDSAKTQKIANTRAASRTKARAGIGQRTRPYVTYTGTRPKAGK
jgi:hypothetical protein